MEKNDKKKNRKTSRKNNSQPCDDLTCSVGTNNEIISYSARKKTENGKKNTQKNQLKKKYLYECIQCKYKTDRKSNYDRHILTPKHKSCSFLTKTSMVKKITRKKNISGAKYFCDLCNFGTNHKSNFSRHLVSKKHKNNDSNEKIHKLITDKKYICDCGKGYKYLSGLSRHVKECNLYTGATNDIDNISKKVVELINESGKLNQTIINNTQNNQYNLKIFLNEKCKDAMNLLEFVDSINYNDIVKDDVYDKLADVIIKKLKNIDITKRPIHCTDKKRSIIYVKDDNLWQKDNEQKKLISAITLIQNKQDDANIKNIKLLKDTNPEWKNNTNVSSDIYKATKSCTDNLKVRSPTRLLKMIVDNTVINKDDLNNDL